MCVDAVSNTAEDGLIKLDKALPLLSGSPEIKICLYHNDILDDNEKYFCFSNSQ